MAQYNHVAIPRAVRYPAGPELSKWAVYVDAQALHGYYEHDEIGEGGELWFARASHTGRLELTDFDGRSELPISVAKALEAHSVIVDDVFKP